MLASVRSTPAQSPAAIGVLRSLHDQLISARARPRGSEWNPPHDDLKQLVGVSRETVKQELGPPSGCETNPSNSCVEAKTWQYIFGEAPDLRHLAAGVLELQFNGDRVAVARWQGQK
jgi:hypothetical protein